MITDKLRSTKREINTSSDKGGNRSDVLVELALKHSHVGIWVADLIKSELKCDDNMRVIFKVSPDYQMEWQNAYVLFKKGHDRYKIARAVLLAQNLKKSFDLELAILHSNQSEHWIRLVGNPIFENDICIRLEGIVQDIQTQKLAEFSIFRNENKFNQLVNNLKNVVTHSDLSGKIHFISPSVLDQFGYQIHEMIGKSGFDFIHPDDIEQLFEIQESELDSPAILDKVEFRFRHKSGHYLWCFALFKQIYEDGEIISIQSETVIIQGQKELEKKLYQSEATFRTSIEQAGIGMALIHPSGQWIMVNEALCKMTGYSREELFKMTFADFTHPDDKDRDALMIVEMLNGERNNYQYEKRYIHKEGHVIYVFLAVNAIYDIDGVPVHAVVQVSDITAQKQTEEALKEAERRFREIFDSAYQFIGFLDANGTFLEVNKTALKFAGVTEADILGKKFWEAYWWPVSEDLKKKLMYSVSKAAEGEAVSYEIQMSDKNRKEITVDFRMQPIFDNEGQVTSMLCEGHLIQEIVEARYALQEIVGKLQRRENELETLVNITEEQNKRLLNFAHIVSHNLRSHSANLTMLITFAHEEEDELQKEVFFEHLQNAAIQLNETISNLNEVVDASSNVFENMRTIALYEMVQSTLPNIKSLIKISETTIVNNVPKRLVVKAVPAYLESIILNFLTNAIKYASPLRKPLITIDAENLESGDVEISFKDNGIGIDLKTNGHLIFGMYKTFHGNADAKGIGLYISKNQIEAMGGKISVKSNRDEGTTFTILLKS